MGKEFRHDSKLAEVKIKELFPDENVRKSYLNSILECVKVASSINNSNWNVNLSNHLIRLNCGNRYIFNMRAENIRVMCWRDSFLKLDRNVIRDFLENVSFCKDDSKELMASSYNPKTYEDLVAIPANILWHNSLQFNIPPKLWAEKYADFLMPSVLDFCKDCIKKSSIMTQMQQAHSTGLIELINEQMNENLIQPEYVKEESNYEIEDVQRFKNLLEYFVTHLEWIEHKDNNFIGYEKYIKPIEHFKISGRGEDGHKIQSQIKGWDCYKGRTIGITIINAHGRGYQQRNCYLHWMRTWYNIHAKWENDHVTSLYLSKEEKVDAKEELKKTIEELGLFSENVTNDLEDFFQEYMKYGLGDSQMISVQEKLVEKYTTLLQNTKNLVLTGAPGTGKTYLAKQIAKAMGCTENEIGFVQFHQSYDYTDFVEGLRPVQDANGNGNQIGFERKDGVFKEFCRKALFSQTLKGTNLFDGVNDNPVIWKVSLDGTGENPTRTDCMENGCIRIGWEGYGDIEDFSDYENFDKGGKFILRNFQKEMKIGDIVVSCYSATETDAIGIVTGDYEYKEENDKILPRYRKVKWLVKNIRENIVEINGGKTFTLSTIYKTSISLQSIKNIVLKYDKERTSETTHQAKKNFVFIIDEINRGEVSKIFGELFYCIDPGYRGEKGRISTQYQNLVTSGEFQKGFFIPENVYIIGTMNDIDRSVESMDFAFRRRFAWAEIKAEETQYMLDKFVDENGETHGLSEELAKEAKEKMNRLNKAISDEQELGSAYHIGASYFLKLNQYEGSSEEKFKCLWNFHIKGLLEEYLRGNPAKDDLMKTLKTAYDGEAVTNEG